MDFYIGLDIGGTKILAGRGEADGTLHSKTRRPTPIDLQEGLALLDEMIAETAEGDSPAGIGVAIGGPLDWHTGVVSPLNQPQWRDIPLKALLEARWGCRVSIEVDTNIAALGEYVLGRYTCSRFLYITISTGVGGGFLMDGHLYRGGFGGAHPEIGHIAAPFRCSYPEKVRCACGAEGCLEALVSGSGIRRIYGVPAEELALHYWEEVAWNLGQGLRNAASLYRPDIIVLGGGIACALGERLIGPAREAMREGLRLGPVPEVRVSEAGYEATLKGCLLQAARKGEW